MSLLVAHMRDWDIPRRVEWSRAQECIERQMWGPYAWGVWRSTRYLPFDPLKARLAAVGDDSGHGGISMVMVV